jgi:hypothetical protein
MVSNLPANPNRKSGPPTYSVEIREKARELFFKHYPLGQISKVTKIDVKTLERWAYGNKTTKPENTWIHQRKTREAELCDALVEDNVYHLQNLFRVSLPLLTDAVSARAKEHYGVPDEHRPGEFKVAPKPMTMKEAKELTEIVTSLDRLFRLETKKPTSLMGFVPVSLEDLKNAIKGDAFLDITADGKLAIPTKEEKDVTPAAGDVPQLDDGFGADPNDTGEEPGDAEL